MIIVACDICRKTLLSAKPDANNHVFCEKHQSLGEQYALELAQLNQELQYELAKRYDRFRNEFMRKYAAEPPVEKLRAV